MDSPQLANQQQNSTQSTVTEFDLLSTTLEGDEVRTRYAATVGQVPAENPSIPLQDVDALIAASHPDLSFSGEIRKLLQDNKESEDQVEFSVNGTTVWGEVGEDVFVPPIHLFPGVTLDMNTAPVHIEEVRKDGMVSAVSQKDGARVIITFGSDEGFTQVLEVAASDIVLEGINGQKGGTGSISGSIISQMAFILPDGSLLMTEGGTVSRYGIISRNNCKLFKSNGAVKTFSRIDINSAGVFANLEKIEGLELASGSEQEEASGTSEAESTSETSETLVGSGNSAEEAQAGNGNEEGSEPIDITDSGNLVTLGKQAVTQGVRSLLDQEYTTGDKEVDLVELAGNAIDAVGNVVDIITGKDTAEDEEENDDEEEEEPKEDLGEAITDTVQGAGDDILDAAKEQVEDSLAEGKNVKDAVADGLQAAKEKLVETMEGYSDLVKELEKTRDSLKKIGVPTGYIDSAISEFDSVADTATGSVADFLGVEREEDVDDEEEEEEDDSKGFQIKMVILPGLLSVNLEVTPTVSLSMGGRVNISEQFKRFTFGLYGKGEVGVAVTLAAEVGNAILALTGELEAGGKFIGGLNGGDGTFFTLEGFSILVTKDDKGQFSAAADHDAELKGKIDLQLSFGGALKVGSEVINWEKEIVSGKVEKTVSTIGLTGTFKKKGNLLSLGGWSMSDVNIMTAVFDQAKAKAIDVAMMDENNMGGINDYMNDVAAQRAGLEQLDKMFEELSPMMSSVSAMGFNKSEDSVNKKMVRSFNRLWEAYESHIRLAEIEKEEIENVIEDYRKLEDVKDSLGATRRSIQKRDEQIASLTRWHDKLKDRFDEGRISRDTVLAKYKEAFGGRGYERDDKAYRKQQAEEAVYSKNQILAYETERNEEKRKIRQTRIATLEAYINDRGLDTDKADEDFMDEYKSVRGSGSGVVHHLLEHGVEMGLFTSEYIKDEMLKYETERVQETSGKSLNKFLNEQHARKEKAIAQKKPLATYNTFDKGFNKDARKADDDVWTDYVLFYSTVADLAKYEQGSTENEVSGVFSKKDSKRFEVVRQLRDKRAEMALQTDESEKNRILNEAKELFNNKDMIDEDTRKGLYDTSNRYMTLSVDQMKERMRNLATLEGYISASPIGERIRNLKENDPEKINRELYDNEANREIYSRYVDHVVTSKDYGNRIFSIDKIISYENSRKAVNHEEKHGERIEYLQYEAEKIFHMNREFRTDAAAGETKKAVENYFSGMRPTGYRKSNTKDGVSRQVEGELAVNVAPATQYIEDLKSTPPTRDGMLEALNWQAGEELAEKQLATGAALAKEETNAYGGRLFEQWSKGLNISAKDAAALMNSGLGAVTEENVTLDNMINYLEFILGDKKHLNRYSAIRDMADQGVGDAEVKKFYKEQLRAGNGYAEKAAEDRNVLTNEITPNLYLMYVDDKGVVEMIESRSPKHQRRIEKISQTGGSKEEIAELIRWYVAEGATRFNEQLLERSLKSGKLTPQMIMDYEKKKAEIGSTKHKARIDSVMEAKDDEEARRIYENAENKGGAGFEAARFKDMDKRAEAIATARSGQQEYDRIIEYETKRRDFWKGVEDKIMKPIRDLEDRREELIREITLAQDKMARIDDGIRANLAPLENPDTNLDRAKGAVANGARDVELTKNAAENVDKLVESMGENRKAIEKNKEELSKLETELKGKEDEMKKAGDVGNAAS